LRKRCYYKKGNRYENYGGRGIEVCPEWEKDYPAFKRWALANGYSDDLTIDRIDNDGDYTPGNCQWITKSENSKKRHGGRN
jgi:hypothetical protein